MTVNLNEVEIIDPVEPNEVETVEPDDVVIPETGEDPPPNDDDKFDYGETFNEQVARQMGSIQKVVLSLLFGEKPVDMYDFAYAGMENKAFSDDDLRKLVSSGLLSSDDYEKIKASFNK
ncbi:hypothetical protein PPK13_gp53 [Bacillus phage Ray17]|uniref:Uncharacterized protein n=1 Tax=Bacillus phage Ray17 TaxID=2315627 RepID=A0A386K756_9CAUD|nr:hypothetical protein PPK13_gp53 [Bacillus phage Ray17]AYD80955.1 hypothetical protein Ray17_54 [Bacillus phage Ray17]